MSGRYSGICCCTDLSVPWVDTRQVDFADELDSRWVVGILIAAVHLQRVNPVLMDALEEGSVSIQPRAKGLNIRVEGPVLCHSSST